MRSRTGNSTPPRASANQIASYTRLLAELYPDPRVELDFETPFQLLVATILAAQSTDKMINTITPALFARYPSAAALAAAEPAELEKLIFRSGFYRAKARSLLGMARALVERHGGEVPRTMAELVALPGVARKTANVILGSALGITEGVVVDTHVTRLAGRLGLSPQTDPVKIEQDLMAALPREQWTPFAHRLILHGRRVCAAKTPDCDHCALAPVCPSAGIAAQAAAKPKPKPKATPKPKPKPKPKAKPKPKPKAKR